MNGATFHQYLAKLVAEAYDATHAIPRGATAARRHAVKRASFIAAAIERTAQAAQLFVCEVEAASLPPLPTPAQESAMEAHENDLRELEGKHASDCAVFSGYEEHMCDCRPDYAEDDGESMDGDHETAMESVYGPDNDEPCEVE